MELSRAIELLECRRKSSANAAAYLAASVGSSAEAVRLFEEDAEALRMAIDALRKQNGEVTGG